MHMINGFLSENFRSLMIGCYVGFTIRKERWRSIIRRMRKRGWWWWLLILLRRRIRNARVTWFHRTSRVLPRFRASRNGLLILTTRLMRPCLVPCCKMTLLSLSFRISLISPVCSRTRWSRNRSSIGVLVLRGKVVKGIEFEAFSEYPATEPEGGTRCRILTREPSWAKQVTETFNIWWRDKWCVHWSLSDSSARLTYVFFVLFIKWYLKKQNCKRNSDYFKSHMYSYICCI